MVIKNLQKLHPKRKGRLGALFNCSGAKRSGALAAGHKTAKQQAQGQQRDRTGFRYSCNTTRIQRALPAPCTRSRLTRRTASRLTRSDILRIQNRIVSRLRVGNIRQSERSVRNAVAIQERLETSVANTVHSIYVQQTTVQQVQGRATQRTVCNTHHVRGKTTTQVTVTNQRGIRRETRDGRQVRRRILRKLVYRCC